MNAHVGIRRVIPSRIHEEDVTGQLMPDESHPWPFINMSTEISAAVAAERERCAKIADNEALFSVSGSIEESMLAEKIAELIRSGK